MNTNPLGANPLGQMAQTALTLTTLEQRQLELKLGQLGALRSNLASLATKPNLTADDIRDRAGKIVDEAGIPASMMATELSTLNDAHPQEFVKQQLKNVMDTEQQIRATYGGGPQMYQMGGYGQLASPSAVTGQANPIGGPQPITAAPGAPVMGQGGEQSQLSQGLAPSGGSAPPFGSTNTTGLLPTGLPPGQTESAKLAVTERAALPNMVQQRVPVEQIIRILKQGGPNLTGVGEQEVQQLRSFLVDQGVANAKTEDKAALIGELDKYYNQNTVQQQAATNEGRETDFKTQMAIAGNPNLKMVQPGALAVAGLQLAQMRANQARIMEFNRRQSGGPDGKPGAPLTTPSGQILPGQPRVGPDTHLGTWNSDWSKNIDYRAYALDYMDPAERNKLLNHIQEVAKTKGINDPEVQKFRYSLAVGKQNGLLNSPNYWEPTK
jgi:hypothetical protein